MTTPDAPLPTVWPAFRARDARGLIRFLVDAFGFEETAVYGDQPDGGGDVVAHAELSWPLGGGIMLGSVRDDGAWPVQPGSAATYLVTDDVDAAYARAQAAGAEVLQELHDAGHGREFAVRDPEGNLWSVGTYRGQPRGGVS